MAVVYFDSSALVKLVVDEPGSTVARRLWNGCDAAVASRLAYPEVRSALASAARNHDIDDEGLVIAEAQWTELWSTVRPVELTARVEQRAGELAKRHGLRGADAVHLASALALDLDLVVAVWDRRLRLGAGAEALAVAPVVMER